MGLGTPLHDGALHGSVGQIVDVVIERVAAATDRGVGGQPVPGDGTLLRERPERPPEVLVLDGLTRPLVFQPLPSHVLMYVVMPSWT